MLCQSNFITGGDHVFETMPAIDSISSKLIISLIIIVIAWGLNQISLTLIHRRIKDMKRFYHIKKTLQYFLTFLVILIILFLWISRLSALPTILGLFSAGIAIALKDLFANIAAWIFIVWRKPFEVEDRVAVNGVAGDVIDQRLFQFTINEIHPDSGDQSTGRIIHIPNAIIFTTNITNYGQGFQYIWGELKIVLTYESNWQKAKKAFLEMAEKCTEILDVDAEERLREAAKKYMIYYSKLTPIVYTSIEPQGIALDIRFLCDPQQKRTMNERLSEAVLTYVSAEEDLHFAYPTSRVIVDSNT